MSAKMQALLKIIENELKQLDGYVVGVAVSDEAWDALREAQATVTRKSKEKKS